MGLMMNYLVKAGNAEEFFNAIRNARAPERFTNSFLKDLDFSSSNDRLYIGVLKGLHFLDENGVPTERYFAFLDQSRSGSVLAEAIREGYEDLFAINKDAHKLMVDEVQGKLKTLTRGQKSDNVVSLMANTFRTLCDLADWSPLTPASSENPPAAVPVHEKPLEPRTSSSAIPANKEPTPFTLHYNIQLILPDSRDPAVYEALFASLRKHLL